MNIPTKVPIAAPTRANLLAPARLTPIKPATKSNAQASSCERGEDLTRFLDPQAQGWVVDDGAQYVSPRNNAEQLTPIVHNRNSTQAGGKHHA
jgi:hypothetical protein